MRISAYVAFCATVLVVAVAPDVVRCQTGEKLIPSLRGKDLFMAYCASCHGMSGKGDGPAAAALRTKPADLTVLGANHGGVFPSDEVRRFIAGDNLPAAHGTREMPIWGPIFSRVEMDTDYGKVRLENLVRYLESIQQRK